MTLVTVHPARTSRDAGLMVAALIIAHNVFLLYQTFAGSW